MKKGVNNDGHAVSICLAVHLCTLLPYLVNKDVHKSVTFANTENSVCKRRFKNCPFHSCITHFAQSSKMGTVTKGFDARLANRPFFVFGFRALSRSTQSA